MMQSLMAGRYRLRERIGRGGMASVWLARDEVLVRQVAVKLIDPELARDPEFRRRFRDEARSAPVSVSKVPVIGPLAVIVTTTSCPETWVVF